MAEKKHKDPGVRVIDAGRAETPIEPTDPEVLEEFEDAARLAGSGPRQMRRKLEDYKNVEGPVLSGRDPDADWNDAAFVGEEAVTGENPTPDQSIVSDIGEAVGDSQQDEKPLQPAVERLRVEGPEDLEEPESVESPPEES